MVTETQIICHHCGKIPFAVKMPTEKGECHVIMCAAYGGGIEGREKSVAAGVCFNRPLTNSHDLAANAWLALADEQDDLRKHGRLTPAGILK